MASATKTKRKKKTTKPMTPSEMKKEIEGLPASLRADVKKFLKGVTGQRRRSYNDPSISKADLKLGRRIQKETSYRFAEECLKMISRNGMSFYDATHKKAKKSA